MRLKKTSANWWPFCPGGDELIYLSPTKTESRHAANFVAHHTLVTHGLSVWQSETGIWYGDTVPSLGGYSVGNGAISPLPGPT